ncbi:MAG: oligosaccharide flippase family protein [Candidatus Omnitrophica bacterium]|nr:oligosaccharide flippase family protein [Candidatus Omnitrophota bacterium]
MGHATKKAIFKDSSLYISSNYIAQFLGFVISVATKRFLGPTMVGVWNVVQVILGYCDYATLGASKAAFREIPYYRGRKEWDKAEQIKNEVFTFTVLMALLPAIGIAIYAFWTKEKHSNYLYIGLLYVAAIILIQRVYDYYTTIMRANKEFYYIAQVTVLSAILNLIFVFILVKPFKIYGLFVASYLSTALGLLFVHVRTHYGFKLKLSSEGLQKIMGIGIPLLLVGLSQQTIRSVDKIMIATYLGVTALGNYSIALMFHQYIIGIPNMLAIVLYPRLQEKYGESGSAAGIQGYLLYPVWVVGLITAFLIGLAILAGPILIHTLLPKFTAGLPAMKVLLLSTFFMAIGQQANTFLITLDKQWRMLPILMVGVFLIALFDFVFVRSGMGLVGVAWGVVLGSMIYNLMMLIYAKSHFSGSAEVIRFIGALFLMLGYFFVLTFLLSRVGNDFSFLGVLLRCGLYVLLTVPCAWYVNRRTGLLTVMGKVMTDQLNKMGKRPESDAL